jgi:hypothetical protein
MQLHNIHQHPFLFESVEDRLCPSRMINDNIWRCSGKFELPICVLPKLFAMGHRVSSVSWVLSFSVQKVTEPPSQGPHLLPNNEGDGYHGGLPKVLELAILLPRWQSRDGAACIARAIVQR